MKVVLVNPSTTVGMRSAIDVEGAWPPLGLLYLATMLELNGANVKVIDNGPLGLSPKEIFKLVRDEKPDVVGFHTLSMSSLTANEIARLIKKSLPDVWVIYGGYNATINHRRILREREFVDVVVREEGEYTILKVVGAIERGKSLRGIRGVSFREGGRIRINPSCLPIEDLDSLPFPDPRFLNFEYCGTISGLKTAIRKFTSVITSRGCPFFCRFCCESIHKFKTWRSRSPENVVEELLYLESLGYGQVYFVDDSFTVNQRRVIELCRLIKRERVDMIWAVETRVSHAKMEMLQSMRSAGCQALFFGIESAVPWVLRYYRKGTTPMMARDAVRNCHRAGMDAYGGFILGAPGETRREMWTTIKFAEKIGIDFPNFYILYAYPGTPIWNEVVAKDYMNEDMYWETGVAVPVVEPNCVPMEEVKRIVRNGYRYVLTRPDFLIKHVVKGIGNPVRRAIVRKNLSLKKLQRLIGTLLSSEHYY